MVLEFRHRYVSEKCVLNNKKKTDPLLLERRPSSALVLFSISILLALNLQQANEVAGTGSIK